MVHREGETKVVLCDTAAYSTWPEVAADARTKVTKVASGAVDKVTKKKKKKKEEEEDKEPKEAAAVFANAAYCDAYVHAIFSQLLSRFYVFSNRQPQFVPSRFFPDANDHFSGFPSLRV